MKFDPRAPADDSLELGPTTAAQFGAPAAPGGTARASDHAQEARHHWRFTQWFTAALVAAWFLITFYVGFFARDLHQVEVLGWPLSFYLAAQGAPFMFVLITWVYSAVMDRAGHVRPFAEGGPGMLGPVLLALPQPPLGRPNALRRTFTGFW